MSNLISINNISSLTLNNDALILDEIMKLNKITSRKNLFLTRAEILDLISNKNINLKEMGRVEFGLGILDKIICVFYDSVYIDKDNYLEMLESLTNAFYLYQASFDNTLTDEEILKYMKKCFDGECAGSIELLESLSFDKLKQRLEDGNLYE